MRKRLFVASFLLGIFLLSGQLVMADFVNVPASAFHQKEFQGGYQWGYGAYYYNTTDQYAYAPVNLPEGAVIKNMRVLCYDNDGTYDMDISLCRVNIFNGTTYEIFKLSTSGTSTSIQNLVDSSCSPAASYRKVYNNVLTYHIRIEFGTDTPGSGMRIYGVTLEY